MQWLKLASLSWILLFATSSAIAADYVYTATLEQSTSKSMMVSAMNINWKCGNDRCVTKGPWPTPGVAACAALAKEVGRIMSYGHPGNQLSADDLAKCNASSIAPTTNTMTTLPAVPKSNAPTPAVSGAHVNAHALKNRELTQDVFSNNKIPGHLNVSNKLKLANISRPEDLGEPVRLTPRQPYIERFNATMGTAMATSNLYENVFRLRSMWGSGGAEQSRYLSIGWRAAPNTRYLVDCAANPFTREPWSAQFNMTAPSRTDVTTILENGNISALVGPFSKTEQVGLQLFVSSTQRDVPHIIIDIAGCEITPINR
mgnify:CR=1 FL=1